MVQVVNAAPKVIYGGINDQSRGTLVREPETFPQHLPLLRLFTQTGPEKTTLVDSTSGGFNGIFGGESLNRRSKYFNMQSLLAETLLAEGNPFFVKRLRPEDATPPSRLILAIDMVPDRIPKITTPLAGFDYPDQVTEDVVDTGGAVETVMGIRAKIVLINSNSAPVGSQVVMPGSFVAEEDGTQSTLYPLLELPASFFGSDGNNLGIRMWAPTTRDALSFDAATAEEFLTRMYRIQFMRRASASGSPVAVRTINGEEYVDICFKEGVYSQSSDVEYYAGQVLINAYDDDGSTTGTAPRYSPFEKIHIYHDNLATVQQLIYDNELVVNPAAATHLLDKDQVDVFTAIDIDGYRYHGIVMEGPLEGGVRLGMSNTVYASGGTDGDTGIDMYTTLVDTENRNFGELGDDYSNIAHYPFSVVYDTGLPLESKYQMMEILGRRQDIRCIFTTFVESENRAPTMSEEISRAQAIMARLRAYPESTLFGTAVCRADVVLQTGLLADGGFTKPVPQVLDYAQRWARYGGAGTGVLREGAAIDVSPNNRVTLVNRLNVGFFNERVASNIWENGGMISQSYDRRSQYYPAIKSVYSDDTSVLISPITVSICCDVMRLVRRVHADFSGNADLTKEQLIEQCDNRILEEADGRYGDRVQIIPRTYFTDADDKRGFSWHCTVTVAANNPRNVMIFDLETRRMEDLGQ